ncbi:hypothetical protein FACS189447_05460 [Spirochaetia bacterium]|nr:hypothetical protein FACS189447_05460 [Spirochaetia bacterium]
MFDVFQADLSQGIKAVFIRLIKHGHYVLGRYIAHNVVNLIKDKTAARFEDGAQFLRIVSDRLCP